MAKARLGRPEHPEDGHAYDTPRSVAAIGEMLVLLTAAT